MFEVFSLIVLPDVLSFFLFNNVNDFNSSRAITHLSHSRLLVNIIHKKDLKY